MQSNLECELHPTNPHMEPLPSHPSVDKALHEMDAIKPALEPLDASDKAVELNLVNRVAAEVVRSLPQLSSIRIQQAVFLKQMYAAGEISFQDYLGKMENLFPDRIETLPEGIAQQIKDRLYLIG